jgi:hypothetical protein
MESRRQTEGKIRAREAALSLLNRLTFGAAAAALGGVGLLGAVSAATIPGTASSSTSTASSATSSSSTSTSNSSGSSSSSSGLQSSSGVSSSSGGGVAVSGASH